MKKKALLVSGVLLLVVVTYYITAVFVARAKTNAIVEKALASSGTTLELGDFSEAQLQALLKVQDPNFYHHKGIDFQTPGAGVTTISQGLVKMYYFDDFTPGFQKMEQTLIARFAFDPLTPKDKILKLFLNEAYFGEANGQPIKGFENASGYYFKKSFKEISWDEYLSLVAMIRAPYNFHYINNKGANLERVSRIKRVLNGGYLPVDNRDIFYDRQ